MIKKMLRRRGGGGFGRWGGRGLGGGYSISPNGECICPNCNHRAPHQRDMPCYTIKCPLCGAMMTRPYY